VALLFTLLARRKVKPLWLPMAVVTALMLPAVVYLRAHFVVDVPAGLLAGLVAYGVSIKMIYK
jgi:membrane-associated phospholipid phosphatase